MYCSRLASAVLILRRKIAPQDIRQAVFVITKRSSSAGTGSRSHSDHRTPTSRMPDQLGMSRVEATPPSVIRHRQVSPKVAQVKHGQGGQRAAQCHWIPWGGKTVIATNVSFAVEDLLVRGLAGVSIACEVYRAGVADTVDGFKLLCSTEPHPHSANGGHRPVIMPTSYLGLTHY